MRELVSDEHMSRPLSIAVFGGVYVDLVNTVDHIPVAGEVVTSTSFMTYLGGKASNAAVALARLGDTVSMIGQVGNDALGAFARESLEQNGIDVKYLTTHKSLGTDTVSIAVAKDSRSTVIATEILNISMDPGVVGPVFAAYDRGALSMDGVSITLEPIPVLARVLEGAAKRGIYVFCDGGPHLLREMDPDLLQYMDVIAPNEVECEWLTGVSVVDEASAARAATVLLEQGAKSVIITLGAKGAYYGDRSGPGFFVNSKVVEAIDETGAGDAFRAAFLDDYLRLNDSVRAMNVAVHAGAYAVTHPGGSASMPTKEELGRFMKLE